LPNAARIAAMRAALLLGFAREAEAKNPGLSGKTGNACGSR
jgi:hypothetical protein